MKISVISPVLNEVDFIGYSIMSVLPYIHSIHYGIDHKSNDGTLELVSQIAKGAGNGKVFWYQDPVFDIDPMDMKQYNGAFNALIAAAIKHGAEAVLFLHPDMIVTNPEALLTVDDDALALFTRMKSFAGDLKTTITKGRATQWKNIHVTRFGLHYFGGYGSQNEDFYHRDITGRAYKHYGTEFSKYPFRVADSGININHYCELKAYRRRLEKMKLCLKTLVPGATEAYIDEAAIQHPRVTLEPSSTHFGQFKFEADDAPIPEVFEKYKVFESFKKEIPWQTATESQSTESRPMEPISS